MKKTLKKCLAAGALLGSASLGFAKPAQEFSNVYSFGGSFTSPIESWGAYVTQRYGFTYNTAGVYTAASTNFAIGGHSSLELAADLANYNLAIGKFDPDALYMMYVGPNDYAGDQVDYSIDFASLGGIASLNANGLFTPEDISKVSLATIQAFFPTVTPSINNRATAVAQFVQNLHQGGVQYTVVFNHFNEGYRQAFIGGTLDEEIFAAETYTKMLNETRFNAIEATVPAANVIYIDYKRLVAEVSVDHLSYFTAAELTNAAITASSSIGATSLDAAHPFFDNTSHPHAPAYKLTGQYVASVVESPTQVALVRELPLNVGTSVAQRTRGLASSFFLNEGGSKWTIDAVGDFTNSRTGSFTKKEVGFKNAKTYSGEVFANYRLNTATVLGLRLNHSYTTLDFVAGKGSAKVQETALSLHGAYKFEKPFFVYGSLGAGMLDYGIERKVALGIATRKHKGTPRGNHYFATVGGGYRYVIQKSHDVALTPFVSATYQNVSMGKYTEGGAIQSTTMSFNMPKRQAVVAEAGATLEAKFKPRSHLAILPSISVSYAYDFKNPINDKVKGKVSDMPKEFAVPAYKVQQSSVNVNGQVVAATDSGLSLTLHGGVKPSSRVKTWNVGLSAGLKL